MHESRKPESPRETKGFRNIVEGCRHLGEDTSADSDAAIPSLNDALIACGQLYDQLRRWNTPLARDVRKAINTLESIQIVLLR